MSNRKLVSVQEITNIEPIEGADRIEVARILGWRVVVGKDMHLKPGDRVAYFETDSLLPAYDPRYKAFQARGQKTIHDRIVMHSKHGVQGAWNDGYIAGLSAALWAVVTADGVNRTGCKHFDLHNPGQKEMDLEH